MTGLLLAAAGESVPISGQVMDLVTGQPLIAVNVVVVGTVRGDATDREGRFTITGLEPGTVHLLVSAIGYDDQQVRVALPQTESLIIQLRETFFQMNEVVVTGTRTEKVFQNTPITTEVISRQDIVDSGARDMAELLEQRSGVVVGTGVEGGKTVNLLGIDAKYILVMVDGQPVTGKFNNRISLDQISTAVVDKVEIVKGPSSAMYGSEAMGGVVNIITTRRLVSTPISLRTRFSGSDEARNPFDTGQGKRDVRLNLDQPWRNFRLQLDLDALWANVDKSIKYIDIDDYHTLSTRGEVSWEPGPKHTTTMKVTRYSTEETTLLGTVTTATTNIQRATVSLSHDWQLTPTLNVKAVGRQDQYGREFVRTVSDEINNTSDDESELELSLIYRSDRITLSAGSEIGQASYRNDRVAGERHQLTTTGLYVQGDWPVSSILTLVSGIRVDDNDEIQPVYSPRMAAMFNLGERWKLRTSWGRGFRMPSFMDRYLDWSHDQYGYQLIGNPDLRPEKSRGYNLGIEYYHPGRYQVTLTVYQNRFNDMINDFLLEPGLFTYRNIDRVRFTGLEIQARWNISRTWLASWGYNFVDNRDLSTGKLVPNTQPHTAMVRLSHKHSGGRFSYALKAKFVGPYHPESYDPVLQIYTRAKEPLWTLPIVDYDARLRIGGWIALSAGLRNMLNYQHDEYGPFVGRTFYLELETKFQGGK
ncbi:MAG: TonB-dependent receptor [Fidelibacterota bacterium]|nr:MAG: TonB-dependent receptor [Candidatus Neomarinimicrobiota bacterium]